METCFQVGIQVSWLGLPAMDHSHDHTTALSSFLPFSGGSHLSFLLVITSNTFPQPGSCELLLRFTTFIAVGMSNSVIYLNATK